LKKHTLAAAATAAALLFGAGAAFARNPHCAGGIQYVVQGLRDKERGNTEDYAREMNKAVQQLNACADEDPADLGAVGYLGWAYAELDSAGPAGAAFQKSIDGLATKGDKKQLDIVVANRDHYWSVAFNEGIAKIHDAQAAWADFGKTPSEDEKPLKEEATKNYEAAITALTRAKLLKPGSALTIRNIGTAYALMGRFGEAATVLRNGITEAAKDTASAGLAAALKTVQMNQANAYLDAKDYDKAIVFYGDLIKAEADNPDHYMGLGSALFNRAQTKQDAARRADFKAAGDAYAKAFALKPSSTDLGFNAALAYQYAGELAASEAQWRAVLKQTPDDPEALSSLGSTLADMQKFDEAVQVLQRAVNLKPDNKTFFRQLGAVYSKAGNNSKSTEMLMVFMAMNSGKVKEGPDAAAAAAKAAKPGSAAASTLASMGSTDKVFDWESDNRKLQTWLYITKKLAFTFDVAAGMTLVQKSDWATSGAAGKSANK
jgi:tetratricopeptide (TPR) repeat protein